MGSKDSGRRRGRGRGALRYIFSGADAPERADIKTPQS